MTETPPTGRPNGTKLAPSCTAFYPWRFQSFRTNPAVPDGITPAVNLGTGRKHEINKHAELSTTEKKEDDACRGIDRSATGEALTSDSESKILASVEEAHRAQQPSSIGGGGGRRLRRAGEALDWEFGMR